MAEFCAGCFIERFLPNAFNFGNYENTLYFEQNREV